MQDPRERSLEMKQVIAREVKGLVDAGTFQIILREDIHADANMLSGRFVLAIKSTKDGEVKYKVRFVIGGHRDKLKHVMVHHTATVQPQPIRPLLAPTVARGFDIWTFDVTKAYFKSSAPLLRDIFISKAIPEFNLKPGNETNQTALRIV